MSAGYNKLLIMATNSKLILLALSVICIVIGCGDSNTGSKNVFLKRYLLHGSTYDNDIVMRPVGIFTIDSLLFIVSSGIHDNFGQIFNLNKNLEQVGVFGNIGQGPGEFLNPEPTFVGDDYFYMQNINACEIAKWGIYQTNGKIQASEISRLRFQRYDISGFGTESRRVSPLGDKNFVGSICDPENGFFILFDNNMDYIKNFGKPPILGNRISALSYLRQLSGYLSVNGSSFVFVAKNIPYIACYHIEEGGDTFPTLKWEDTYGKISYTVENDRFNFSNKTIGRNIGVQNKDKYIYILNIDAPRDQLRLLYESGVGAKTILVFDHDGGRVARFDIDYGLYDFWVSKDEKTIYGITQNPDYMVVKYDIPEL